jgi:rhodanese-related sulfurtransferase
MAALLLPIPRSVSGGTLKFAPEQLRLLQLNHAANVLIIDVRDPNAFLTGHIQGAQNIPAKTIETAGLPRAARIVLYCGELACPLSTGAANTLINP